MQNQLCEIVTGSRNGKTVEVMLMDETGNEVSLSKYKFKSNSYTGIKLTVFQNIPTGYKFIVMSTEKGNPSMRTEYLDVDLNEPFGVYKIHDDVDCFIVSGKFKPTHSYKKL